MAEWSAKELELLRRMYVEHGSSATARALGRSRNAVEHRAARLGLKMRRRWTAKDDAALVGMWGASTVRTIARKLERTELAVFWRAGKLGLKLGCQQGMEYLYAASLRTGYGTTQLRAILKWAGVRLGRTMSRPKGARHGRHAVDPFDVDEAIRQFHATELVEPAARARRLDPEALRSWLREAAFLRKGVPPPPRHKKGHWRVPSAAIDAVVAEKRGDGETLRAAAARVGVNMHKLSTWLRAAGARPAYRTLRRVDPAVVDRVVAERRADWRRAG